MRQSYLDLGKLLKHVGGFFKQKVHVGKNTEGLKNVVAFFRKDDKTGCRF